jgi:predicted nucleic acid-binding Zn finger protein
MSAREVVALLNELVTGFDEMTEKYGMSAIAALSSAMVSLARSVIWVEVGKSKDYALNRCI